MAQNHYTQTHLNADSDPDEEEGIAPKTGVYSIYPYEDKKLIYNVYLSESIENNFKYTDLLHTLRHIKADDEVRIYMANYGGQCSTGFQLVNAIRECKAPVHMVLDAPSYSMGAILALSGKSLTMNPGTFLMFHNYTSFDMGKGAELHMAVNHYFDHFHRHLKTICGPFLTNKELRHLQKDNDLYISADAPDIKDRIKRHFK